MATTKAPEAKIPTFRDDRGVRDLRRQREAAAPRDKAREALQKQRDDAARKVAADAKKAGQPMVAKQGFMYVSPDTATKVLVEKGDVFDPDDEAVQHAPTLFRAAFPR